jgi:hypothetical protein
MYNNNTSMLPLTVFCLETDMITDWIRFLLDQKKANFVVVLCYMALLLPLSVCRQNCSSATTSDLVNTPFGILITMNYNIINVQIRYITIEIKKRFVLEMTDLVFHYLYSGDAR